MTKMMIELSLQQALQISDILRTGAMYTLLGTPNEHQLGPDFKPHKFLGYEMDQAEKEAAAYRLLAKKLDEAFGDE